MSNAPYSVANKKESGIAALVQIVVVAAIVGAAVFGWWKFSSEKKRVADLAVKAKEATAGDDAKALLTAEGLFFQIGDEDKLLQDDAILAALAEIESQLYFQYGIGSAKEKAQRYVGKAVERDLKKAERYAAEAYLMLGENRTAEAENLLMDIINNRGARHAKLLHALAVAKLAQGKAKEAIVASQEGQKLSTQLVRLPITEGDSYFAMGNFSGASNAYNKALKLNPDHLRARTAITVAAAVSRQGKPELLVKEMDRLLQEASDNHGGTPPPRVKGFIEYGKGEILLVDNKAKEALEMAEASLATDPGQPATLALKARCLAKLNKVEEAKAAFTEAMEAAPLSLPIATAAFQTLSRAGKAKDGLGYLQKVVGANPQNGLAHAELSLALSRTGDAAGGAKEAEEATKILGNAHDLAIFAKGRAEQADKKGDKALETYKEALGFHGSQEWAELYYALGEVRMDERNWDDAVSAFTSAITFWDKQGGSLDDIADAWEQIGKAHQGMGGKNAKKAGEFFEKAEALRKGKV